MSSLLVKKLDIKIIDLGSNTMKRIFPFYLLIFRVLFSDEVQSTLYNYQGTRISLLLEICYLYIFKALK